jgi:hypothetical protein
MIAVRSEGPAYRLDELGWLQFELLCTELLEREAGLGDLEWRGRADQGRVALVDADVALADQGLLLPGPVAIAVVWVREDPSLDYRLAHLLAGVSAVESELGFWFDRVLVLTNLEAREARRRLEQSFGEVERFVVLGGSGLSAILDRDAMLRAAMPSVLGLRDLDPLLDREALERSSLDVCAAQVLARVFWPTRAYKRARAVLARHRFVVLTGPPEMGRRRSRRCSRSRS